MKVRLRSAFDLARALFDGQRWISRPHVSEITQPLSDRNERAQDQEPRYGPEKDFNESEAQAKQNIPTEGNEVKDSVTPPKLALAQLTLGQLGESDGPMSAPPVGVHDVLAERHGDHRG
jgi:hypothetical protein